MPSSPDSAAAEGAAGAPETKGIPAESGKSLRWKVIKGLSVGGDFQPESLAREQVWAAAVGLCPLRAVAMVPVKPKSSEA